MNSSLLLYDMFTEINDVKLATRRGFVDKGTCIHAFDIAMIDFS